MTQNMEREEHRDERCIEHIANLMREKMKFSREVKGRGGWQDMPAGVLSDMLREHVEKGDPVDVANFCMMLAAKRAPISASEQRRKDAEGQEPAGKVIATFESGQFMVDPHPQINRVKTGEYVYTRPANVAALEARVKQLEGICRHVIWTEEEHGLGSRGHDSALQAARAALTHEGGMP